MQVYCDEINSKVSRIICVPFYAQEAAVAFSSADEAARHFLTVGQRMDLSPSPFVLWGVIRAENSGIVDFHDFLADPFEVCSHPAFAPALYSELCQSIAGDFSKFTSRLSQLAIDESPLLGRFVDAARVLGHRDLSRFMTGLSLRQRTGPGLEMEFFSSTWYQDAYEDVDHAGLNPFRHYVVLGWREGRDPSPEFSTVRYLDLNPDVSNSGANPLIHFLSVGEQQGRRIQRSGAYLAQIRHETKWGRLPAQYVSFTSSADTIIQKFCINFAETRLIIVVPFYLNEFLVPQLVGSLLNCICELKTNQSLVVFVNDSPGFEPLSEALEKWSAVLSDHGVNVALFNTESNLGFINATNIGLRCAELLSCSCLMLNSDAQLQRGSLSEMIFVASLDDRFAFVNPLSNNATLATLGLESTSDASSAIDQHGAVAKSLPRYMIVPTCIGFCLLVKHEIIRLFGFLDLVYGQGYNEENDYIMRANRKGYLAVLAPRAFVSHIGEQSFSMFQSGKGLRDENNGAVLLRRYPEFKSAVDTYFASPEIKARRVVERYPRAIDFVIDAGTLPGIINGTSVLARELIPRIVRRIGVARCAVRGSNEYLNWLGLAGLPGLVHWLPSDANYAKVAVRLSQPFDRKSVEFLSYSATKLVFFMLDTISDDCLYLRDVRTHDLWDWVSEFSDALIFNSPYSMALYQRRFDVAPRVLQCASYHSLNVDEYLQMYDMLGAEKDFHVKPFVLIVGNYYQHKAIEMTLAATEDINLPRVALGTHTNRSDIISFDSGRLRRDEIAFLYKKAAVIIYPSLYEGFGFPLMEGLASGNPVIVHSNALNRDLVHRLGSPPAVLMFESFSELRSLVDHAMALGHLTQDLQNSAKNDGWNRSINEIAEVLNSVHDRDIDFAHVVKRQKALKRMESL